MVIYIFKLTKNIYSKLENNSSFNSSFTDFPLIKLPPETDLFLKYLM